MKRCVGDWTVSASLTSVTTLAKVVSAAAAVTTMSNAPGPLTVAAKTRDPLEIAAGFASALSTLGTGAFSTGIDSPVTADWSIAVDPTLTNPSAGTREFGRTTTTSPTTSSSTGRSSVALSPTRTVAVRGASSASASIERVARAIANSSSACPMLNRNKSTAPSASLPTAAAPTAATIIKKSTSKRPRRTDSHAPRTVKKPPKK